jgi:predicted transcriptional regulator
MAKAKQETGVVLSFANALAQKDGYTPITNVYEMTRFVQGCIRESKMKFKDIAKKAECCNSTVARLADGTTKDPRQGTVIRILLALGRTIYVR